MIVADEICPFCKESVQTAEKFTLHLLPLEKRTEPEKKKEVTLPSSPAMKCSTKDCEDDAALGYYCCRRGGEYKERHCLTCFLNSQKFSARLFAGGADKICFQRFSARLLAGGADKIFQPCPSCGELGKFHTLDIMHPKLKIGKTKVKATLLQAKILKSTEEVKELWNRCEQNGGKKNLQKGFLNLMGAFKSEATLLSTNSSRCLIECLLKHQNMQEVLQKKLDGSDSGIVLQNFLMMIINHTIEPWDLSLPSAISTALPGPLMDELDRVFRYCRCYASDINLTARDAFFPLWLEHIFSKIRMARNYSS